MTVVNRDGVFLGDARAWTAWSRRADAQWLADQLDARPRPPRSDEPEYRWPGAFLGVVEDTSAVEQLRSSLR